MIISPLYERERERERERGGGKGGGGRITRVLEIIIVYVVLYFQKQTLSFL